MRQARQAAERDLRPELEAAERRREVAEAAAAEASEGARRRLRRERRERMEAEDELQEAVAVRQRAQVTTVTDQRSSRHTHVAPPHTPLAT
jgi:hypothetical protein